MFKWYVTRGYPLQDLLDSTYAERLLLREAYSDWMKIWESLEKDPKLNNLQRQV